MITPQGPTAAPAPLNGRDPCARSMWMNASFPTGDAKMGPPATTSLAPSTAPALLPTRAPPALWMWMSVSPPLACTAAPATTTLEPTTALARQDGAGRTVALMSTSVLLRRVRMEGIVKTTQDPSPAIATEGTPAPCARPLLLLPPPPPPPPLLPLPPLLQLLPLPPRQQRQQHPLRQLLRPPPKP